jgi:trans-aconitate 2-methyltransferase
MNDGRGDAPGDAWDPVQYARYRDERAAPFRDLVGLVAPPRAARVADLGCGTGALTVGLLDAWQPAEVLAIDSSPAMLAGVPRADDRLRPVLADIGALADIGTLDVIVSNAALQWVPDHPRVLADWTRRLRPGGQLAVQVPANAAHPSHRLLAAVAAELLGAGAPPDPTAVNVLAPARYAELLHELGYGEQHVRLQVYGHTLASTAAVVEWMKGTSLTRLRSHLPAAEYDGLVERYRRRLLAELGDQQPYFFAFTRILLWGRQPG